MIRKVYNFCLFAFMTHYEKNVLDAKTFIRNTTPLPPILTTILFLWETILYFIR